MTTSNGLATIQPNADEWNDERREFVRKAFCGGAPDNIAGTFLALCERRRLSPEARHVYLVNRAKKGDIPNWVIQTGIDGYRLIADRTGRYAGSDDAMFEQGPNGKPSKATVTVRKLLPGGVVGAFSASARWDEYSAGSPMWSKMPHTMLAKCAEALALRKAFPEELSGMYTDAEMDQAEHGATARVIDVSSGEILDAPQMPSTRVETAQDANVVSAGITPNQMGMIRALAERKGVTNDGIKRLHGKASAKDLTKQEASALIDTLMGYPDIIVDEDPGEYIDEAGDVHPYESGTMPLGEVMDPDRYTR